MLSFCVDIVSVCCHAAEPRHDVVMLYEALFLQLSVDVCVVAAARLSKVAAAMPRDRSPQNLQRWTSGFCDTPALLLCRGAARLRCRRYADVAQLHCSISRCRTW